MNILCATDDKYAPYCGVMLTSLLANNKGYHINIYILCSEISHINEKRFHILETQYDCSIRIIRPDERFFEKCPIKDEDHISRAAYYRIMCDSLLPSEITRILYLDCDIIVNTNISSLYYMDMGISNIVAACIDSYNTIHRKRLGLEHDYFCSGVMLFDLSGFRKGKCGQKCIEAINANPDKFIYHDQDALNIVLNDRVTYISPKWNMMSAFLRHDKTDLQMTDAYRSEIESVVFNDKDAFIIHYEYLPKPWQKWVMMPHPFTKLWYHYRSISPWPDAPINYKVPLRFKLNVVLLRVLWKLRFKKCPAYYLV